MIFIIFIHNFTNWVKGLLSVKTILSTVLFKFVFMFFIVEKFLMFILSSEVSVVDRNSFYINKKLQNRRSELSHLW
jgi:hypothetical protein